MSDQPGVVGDFKLAELAGRGGMSVVWRAEQVRSGLPVAVKFFTGKRGAAPDYRDQFRSGVQASARLSHGAIATVFDYGWITEPAPSVVGVGLGTPWVAMEWGEAGTLADIVPLADWPTVRAILVAVLEGLAHAHARGVIHGDLRPTNLIVDRAGQPKIVDFGTGRLAVSSGRSDRQKSLGGAPKWMAPEQISGARRDHGPWSDLYALGCIAYWLFSYRAPFQGTDVESILEGHLNGKIPRLKSRMAVPHEIETWLRRMLAKDPSDRYRFAADAAYDLLAFPDDVSVVYEEEIESIESFEARDAPDFDAGFGDESVGLDEPSSYALYETTTTPARWERRQLPPRSWARAKVPRQSPGVVEAGVGLWGLRSTPIVDRDEAREAMWSELREVHQYGTPRIMILRGPAGTGKTTLARWLAQRATEVGAAHVLTATHAAIDPTGIGGMLADHFSTHGLDGMARLARIRKEFSDLGYEEEEADTWALFSMIGGGGDSPSAEVHHRGWHALLRYLDMLTTDRPAIMTFEDLQWGGDTLLFLRRVAKRASGRFLLVGTVRDDALVAETLEAERLRRLTESDRVTVLDIDPLAEPWRRELLDGMLDLDPVLANRVAERAAGNPLFARQLVDDWVQRKVVQIDDAGCFRLTDGADDSLPGDLRSAFARRTTRFLDQFGDHGRHALELAAVLGQSFRAVEWTALCGRQDVEIPEGFIDALTREGLVVATQTGWCFQHSVLREQLVADAHEAGRAHRWHVASARLLAGSVGNAERRAKHFIAAAHLEESLVPLLQYAESVANAGDFERVDAIFWLYRDVVAALDDDPEAALQGYVAHARVVFAANDLDRVDELLTTAEKVFSTFEEPDADRREMWLAEINLLRGGYYAKRGRISDAVVPAEQALAVFRRTMLDERTAEAHLSLAQIRLEQGRLEDAAANFRAARSLHADLGDELGAGQADLGLARIAHILGDFESRAAHRHSAIEAFTNARSQSGIAEARAISTDEDTPTLDM